KSIYRSQNRPMKFWFSLVCTRGIHIVQEGGKTGLFSSSGHRMCVKLKLESNTLLFPELGLEPSFPPLETCPYALTGICTPIFGLEARCAIWLYHEGKYAQPVLPRRPKDVNLEYCFYTMG